MITGCVDGAGRRVLGGRDCSQPPSREVHLPCASRGSMEGGCVQLLGCQSNSTVRHMQSRPAHVDLLRPKGSPKHQEEFLSTAGCSPKAKIRISYPKVLPWSPAASPNAAPIFGKLHAPSGPPGAQLWDTSFGNGGLGCPLVYK